MEESLFGSSPVDLFPRALPTKPSEKSGPRQQRKLSVREIKIQRSEDGVMYAARTSHSHAKALWKTAFSLISSRGDPWEKFHLQELPEEIAKRYRYNAIKGKWVEDIVRIKIENTPFNRGAMRECFRAKKLSNFSHCSEWSHASNHVAKRYIDKVDAHVYFDDVRLQMDAKLWGEEFSRQPSVPKKVDIAQMCVLEFIDRPGKPLYHLEHFIEGTYRKYNSNSGFVDDLSRNTPQAFSHFTFERSGHRLIVVDIQGVGNLWTDPQIHTFNSKSYGDGNLGIRGMALFFYTHRCNPLCLALALSAFDLPMNDKLSVPFSQLSMKEKDNQTEEDSIGINDNNNNNNNNMVEFSGTIAIPASRRNRYGVRRLISENYDSNNMTTEISGDFVNPIDFTESHSVPSPKLPFLPLTSPVLHRNDDYMSNNDQIINNHHHHNTTTNGIVTHDKYNIKYNSTTSTNNTTDNTTDNNNNNAYTHNNHSTDDLIFGPMSLHNNSYDSGISFNDSSYGGAGSSSNHVLKTQQSMLSDTDCNEDLNQSNDGHLHSSCEHSQQHCKVVVVDQLNSQVNSNDSSQQLCKETELVEFFRLHQAGHRSSSVAALHGADMVILGLIHHELARLHASGRLSLLHRTGHNRFIKSNDTNQQYNQSSAKNTGSKRNGDQLDESHASQNVDWQAVLFHMEQSAKLGCLDAIQCLAQFCLNLMIDGPLSGCPIKPDPLESRARGFALMSSAASAGDRMAMLYLAEANYHGEYYFPEIGNGYNDSGISSSSNSSSSKRKKREPDWLAAAHWYEMATKVVDSPDAASDNGDNDAGSNQNNPCLVKQTRAGFHSLSEWPIYRLQGRLGEMYAQGGHGLVQNRMKAYELFQSAGDAALKVYEGRLATKYYEQADLLEEYITSVQETTE